MVQASMHTTRYHWRSYDLPSLERVVHAFFALSEVQAQIVLVGGGQCPSVPLMLASFVQSWSFMLADPHREHPCTAFPEVAPCKVRVS